MWDIVWVSPQGYRLVSVSRHFLLQAPQCPCSVRKQFSRDHCYRETSKPVCRIEGLHTRWELTTWADFQLCLHRLLMSSPATVSKFSSIFFCFLVSYCHCLLTSCRSDVVCVAVLRHQGSSQSDSSGFVESELMDSAVDSSTVSKVSCQSYPQDVMSSLLTVERAQRCYVHFLTKLRFWYRATDSPSIFPFLDKMWNWRHHFLAS